MNLVDVQLVVKLLIVGSLPLVEDGRRWVAVWGLLGSSLSLVASFMGIGAVASESTFACINSNSP